MHRVGDGNRGIKTFTKINKIVYVCFHEYYITIKSFYDTVWNIIDLFPVSEIQDRNSFLVSSR